VANSSGVMDFQYDLAWMDKVAPDMDSLAESLSSEPTPLVNPATRENSFVLKDLFQP
jgi:hypothetical protein